MRLEREVGDAVHPIPDGMNSSKNDSRKVGQSISLGVIDRTRRAIRVAMGCR